MNIQRAVWIVVLLAALYGCSGGGGSTTTPPGGPWERFRRDASNTGQAVGPIAANNANIKAVQIDADTPQPISASAAIAETGFVYIGSEGGTLAAVDPTGPKIKWRLTLCDHPAANACGAPQPALGPLVASPTVYTIAPTTSVFVASTNGQVFGIDDTGTTQTCTFCFAPRPADFGADTSSASVSFLSSPLFTTNPVTLKIDGLFLGARVEVQATDGSSRSIGKLYALNSDGSLKWQFPRPGAPEIAPVTSSPAQGFGSSLHFIADDGTLYTLTTDGTFKWAFDLGTVLDPDAPFAPSPVFASAIFAPTTNGDIIAINPDGTFRWQAPAPTEAAGDPFVGSLAVGAREMLTPTPTPKQPTPLPGTTRTPTPTVVPFVVTNTVFGVTKSGRVAAIEPSFGQELMLTGNVAPIDGEVLSSPALSDDSFLVFGTSTGHLYAIDNASGAKPTPWPDQVQIPSGARIRSSPAIATDGTIYVGADDGMLYQVGRK